MKTNEQKNFPGYPHYPATEDITRDENNNGKISIDKNSAPTPSDGQAVTSDADVTPQELEMLRNDTDGPETQNIKNTGLDRTDDEGNMLNEGSGLFDDDELDVPGSELDNKEENIGSEDEENNYYSLGGNDENPEDMIED